MGVYTLGGAWTRQPVRTRKKQAFFRDLAVSLPVRKRQQTRQAPRDASLAPQVSGLKSDIHGTASRGLGV
jgi:hypothetical protein